MEKYFVDIAIVAIILLCAAVGRKNGILGGLISIASAVIALIAGKMFTPKVSPYVGKVISPVLTKIVQAEPEKYIAKYIPDEKAAEFAQFALEKGKDVLDLLIEELTFMTQDVIAFFVIFVIMIIAAGVVLRFLSLHLPLIGTVNKTLGLLFGGFAGIILVMILFSAITNYIEAEQSYITLLPYFENSYFAQFFLK
ncbi:MAG: CvpA family protein [Clostridia bacterium]|nr:CvpA family protein [Clostridia bacterium]MBQ7085887.1 CvpA family protein [Clostridia bacterium]